MSSPTKFVNHENNSKPDLSDHVYSMVDDEQSVHSNSLQSKGTRKEFFRSPVINMINSKVTKGWYPETPRRFITMNSFQLVTL